MAFDEGVRRGRVIANVSNDVRYVTSGHLECTTCDDIWCTHIEEAVKLGADAKSIEQRVQIQDNVAVPLLPSKGIYAKVWLEQMPRDSFRAKVYLQSPPTAEPGALLTGDDQLIGILNTGEGRYTLRLMVLDFFMGKVDTPIVCSSMSHNFSRQAEAEKMNREGIVGQLQNAWTTLWFHKCSPCFNKEGAGIKFDDDAIPDTPPTYPRSRR